MRAPDTRALLEARGRGAVAPGRAEGTGEGRGNDLVMRQTQPQINNMRRVISLGRPIFGRAVRAHEI